jgi:hypothetical protein
VRNESVWRWICAATPMDVGFLLSTRGAAKAMRILQLYWMHSLMRDCVTR